MSKSNGKIKYEDAKDFRFQFFPGQRRQITLEGVTAQCNKKGDDRKIVFHVMMPLTGQPLIGFPGFLQPAWEATEKEASAVTESRMKDFTLEGMKIEFFSQFESKKNIVKLGNKTFYDFVVDREPDGDNYVTVLRFKYRVQETIGAYGFWVKHGFNKVWADFIPDENATKEGDDQQMTLGQGKNDDDEEDSGMPHQSKERAADVAGA